MNKKKIAYLSILLVFLSAATYAENYQIKDISEDCSTAIISGIGINEELSVGVGDYIGDWEVIEIEPDGISIKKDPEEDEPYAVVRKMREMTKFELPFSR